MRETKLLDLMRLRWEEAFQKVQWRGNGLPKLAVSASLYSSRYETKWMSYFLKGKKRWYHWFGVYWAGGRGVKTRRRIVECERERQVSGEIYDHIRELFTN